MTAAGLTPPTAPTAAEKKRKIPTWVWVVFGVIALVIGVILAPFIAFAALVFLVTGIVALAKNTPTWLRLRSRKAAWAVTAAASVVFLVFGGITSTISPKEAEPVSAEQPLAASPTPSAEDPEPAESVDDEATSVRFSGDTATVADAAATADRTAAEVLESLPVKGRAPKTGYDRDEFGQRWLDVDRNGCDTRNDILARDLTDITRSGPCKVVTGILADPFTGANLPFVRGQDTSALVQIDHVVSLSDAWQKGAQQLTADQRASFANDPLNLLAVDGASNAQKGDGDAATWLPKNREFRCAYVARQVSVKAAYGLWVTQAEHDAMARVLASCPDEPALTSAYAAPAPAPVPEPVTPAPAEPAPVPAQPAPAPAQPAPAPAPPAPAPVAPAPAPAPNVSYANCDAVRAAGAAPIRIGDPGYSKKLDRDGDGVGCE